MVHHQNMAGKAKRAQNQKPIPRGDGKVLADAQQIQPGHAQKDGQPYQPRRPSAPQHAQQGHQHDVERRDEPRLARTRAHGDAHLLKGAGQRHAQTVKRKRTQAVRRYILGDEGRAPDKRRKR